MFADDTRVVDDDVELAVPGDRLVHRGGDGHEIFHIAGHSVGSQNGLVPVHNNDLGPLGDEPLPDRLPDSSRPAGDQRHPGRRGRALGHRDTLQAIF